MMMQQENSLLLNSRKNDGWISSFVYNRRSISICFGMFISSLSWIHYVNYVKYYLLQYRRLCDVIRKGDLREYDNIVKDYEYVLIQRGLYVCNKMIESINQSINQSINHISSSHLPIYDIVYYLAGYSVSQDISRTFFLKTCCGNFGFIPNSIQIHSSRTKFV